MVAKPKGQIPCFIDSKELFSTGPASIRDRIGLKVWLVAIVEKPNKIIALEAVGGIVSE